jgi:hypothetical protein
MLSERAANFEEKTSINKQIKNMWRDKTQREGCGGARVQRIGSSENISSPGHITSLLEDKQSQRSSRSLSLIVRFH